MLLLRKALLIFAANLLLIAALLPLKSEQAAKPEPREAGRVQFKEVAAEYPGIQATHYYIDALAMYLVLDPGQFEVIVTNNLFGDIVTDLGATFQGGLGMAASGNIHPGRTSMFEPVHGSAPRFAGRNVANPIGAISSASLMLDTLGLTKEAAAIDASLA